MPLESPYDSTLDTERTDHLRTLLTAEAVADASSLPGSNGSTGHRRLIGGVAVVLMIGAGLFAITSNAGGPTSGQVMVKTASAVVIEKAPGGWTTISIADINADPHSVIAQLQAAGIDTRNEPMALTSLGESAVMTLSPDVVFPSHDQMSGDSGSSFTLLGKGDAGSADFAGLTVQMHSAVPEPFGDGSTPDKVVFDAYTEKVGVRSNSDGSFSIRNDADVTVIVLKGG